MDLKNKTAVITGATGGIGTELVKLLKNEGVEIISVSKNNSDVKCDFRDQSETEKIAAEISNRPKIDILVNCAGVGIYKPLEDWNESMDICTSSSFIFTKYLIN